MNLQHERISALCESLALPVIAQSYAACAQLAVTDSRAYSDFLEDLPRQEAAGRRARTQSMLTRMAGFPAIKTLEGFSFEFAKGVKKSQIEELAGLGFIERRENVVLLGASGVGKTHLANSDFGTGLQGHTSRDQDPQHPRSRFDVGADAGLCAKQPEGGDAANRQGVSPAYYR